MVKSQKLKEITFPKVKFTPCEEAVVRTLCYRAVFDYPMTFFQISCFLFSSKNNGKSYTVDEVKESLRELIKKRVVASQPIGGKNVVYYLRGLDTVDWFERSENSKKLLKKAEEVAKVLKKIPWLSMVAVTGSVAAHNATDRDDIDLFFVTKPRRIWITRFFVVLFLKIMEVYWSAEDESGKICPNLYVSEDNLAWPEDWRNVYIANEVLLVTPVFDRNDVYFRFLTENSWVSEYVWADLVFVGDNAVLGDREDSQEARGNSKSKKEGLILGFFENMFQAFQIFYMKSKMTTEVVRKDLIHFKKFDSTNRVLSRYKEVLGLVFT